MPWFLVSLIVVALVGVSPAYAETTATDNAEQFAEDVTEIENLYATWRKAVNNGDREAYVALLDTQVRLLPPGAAAIDGALLIEADDIGTGVFESGAVRMAEILDSLLDRPA